MDQYLAEPVIYELEEEMFEVNPDTGEVTTKTNFNPLVLPTNGVITLYLKVSETFPYQQYDQKQRSTKGRRSKAVAEDFLPLATAMAAEGLQGRTQGKQAIISMCNKTSNEKSYQHVLKDKWVLLMKKTKTS